MSKDNKHDEELTADEMRAMLLAKEKVVNRFPRRITAGGRKYTVRQISKGVRARIHSLEIEAYALSEMQKDKMSPRKARRIQRRLDRLHAKTAAYYILGNRAVFVPGLFWATWRRLMLRSEEEIAAINDAAVNQTEINFSSANWEITKFQLALSMRPIGEGVREMLKRRESARRQVEEDATKRKEGDEGSKASSGKARTTRKSR